MIELVKIIGKESSVICLANTGHHRSEHVNHRLGLLGSDDLTAVMLSGFISSPHTVGAI